MNIDIDNFLFTRFIKTLPDGGYAFNTAEFSALAGEPIDLTTAAQGEAEILGRYLASQINLM